MTKNCEPCQQLGVVCEDVLEELLSLSGSRDPMSVARFTSAKTHAHQMIPQLESFSKEAEKSAEFKPRSDAAITTQGR